mgnify:CR=1 FL=1
MKKNYFMLAAATMLFAACAETDVLVDVSEKESAPQEISFDAFANKATRAEINSVIDLQTEGEFTVWGWKTQGTGISAVSTTIFDEQKVTYTNDNWGYTPTQYWDKTATYDFYAVAPAEGDATYSINNTTKMITIDGVKSGPSGTATDYLLDRDGVIDHPGSTGGTVQFNFKHIMSKITIQVKQAELDDDKDVILTDLTMSGWNSNPGKFVQNANSEWSIATSGTAGTYQFVSRANQTLSTSVAYEAGSYLMVPQTVASLSFTISYKIGEETFLAHTGVMPAAEIWNTNTHYTYTITVGPEAIKFSVSSVESWDGQGDGNTVIQDSDGTIGIE